MSDPRGDHYVGQFRPEYSKIHRDRDLFWIVPFSPPLILGLVGPRFSGVTTALNFLSERREFDVYSLDHEVRRVGQSQGVTLDVRRSMHDLSDRLRQRSGDPAVLARATMRSIRRDRIERSALPLAPSVALGEIRHVDELSFLQRIDSFHLVVIDPEDGENASARWRRVLSSGVLRAEYRNEQYRRSDYEEAPKAWEKLDDTDRKRFFDSLDAAHANGYGHGVPEDWRAIPGKLIAQAGEIVIGAAERVHRVPNPTAQIDVFHDALDAMLAKVRPRDQVIHTLNDE